MLKQMRAAGKALTQELRAEWDSYGKTGQRVVAGGGILIAAAMAATFAFTKPVCPTHLTVGVGNPEFRCPPPSSHPK